MKKLFLIPCVLLLVLVFSSCQKINSPHLNPSSPWDEAKTDCQTWQIAVNNQSAKVVGGRARWQRSSREYRKMFGFATISDHYYPDQMVDPDNPDWLDVNKLIGIRYDKDSDYRIGFRMKNDGFIELLAYINNSTNPFADKEFSSAPPGSKFFNDAEGHGFMSITSVLPGEEFAVLIDLDEGYIGIARLNGDLINWSGVRLDPKSIDDGNKTDLLGFYHGGNKDAPKKLRAILCPVVTNDSLDFRGSLRLEHFF